MKLGTKLTVYLSLIIFLVLSGYGYFNVLSRRELLVKKMKAEVESTSRNLKVSLEKVQIQREREYVQDLIDGIEEYEKTLGVIVYHPGKDLVFTSRSLGDGTEPYLEMIKNSIKNDSPQEEFGVYKKAPIFAYAFPLKDKKGKNIGGVSILQHTSFMEEDIKRAEWNILITVLILIGGMVAIVLMGTRKWISQPISHLIVGVNHIAKGNLDIRIDLRRKDEISQLAGAFNQMAVDLKKAQERIIHEGQKKLELERNLRQSEKMASLGRVAAGIAHEIRSPLSGINIYLTNLEKIFEKEESREKVREILKQLQSASNKIESVIRRVMDFSKPSEPKFILTDISHPIEEAINLSSVTLRKTGIQLSKVLAEDLPPCHADPHLIGQVILNLIINAAEAMKNMDGAKQIEVSSSMLGNRIVFCVSDSGPGVPIHLRREIFNPFYTTKDGSTGIGLSLCERVITDHSGSLTVLTSKWGGAEFRVEIPIERERKKG